MNKVGGTEGEEEEDDDDDDEDDDTFLGQKWPFSCGHKIQSIWNFDIL